MTRDVRTTLDGVRLAPLELYARAVSLFWPEERDRVFTPETIASIGDAAPWRTLAAYFAAATDAGANDTPDAIHHVELSFRLPHLTAVTTAVTATGLELRLPFADHRLAQILASVPSTSRGGPRERQSWLRAAVGSALPKNLLRAPHRPAAPPASAWAADGLRALAEELFAPHRVAADGVLHPDLVARCWQEHLDGTRDHSARLWTFALVIRWLERRRKRTATASPAGRTVLGLASSDR